MLYCRSGYIREVLIFREFREEDEFKNLVKIFCEDGHPNICEHDIFWTDGCNHVEQSFLLTFFL